MCPGRLDIRFALDSMETDTLQIQVPFVSCLTVESHVVLTMTSGVSLTKKTMVSELLKLPKVIDCTQATQLQSVLPVMDVDTQPPLSTSHVFHNI
jgi:hypothetical protein